MSRYDYGYGYGFGYRAMTVAEKKAAAREQLARLRQENPDVHPVVIEGRKIAKTWWGKAWINNLESYADYANRIGRGRSYVTNGMVLDLGITTGRIDAVVAGSKDDPYTVSVSIAPLAPPAWQAITAACGKSIATIDLLLEGKFPPEMEELFTQQSGGLFPAPKEIKFTCSCPDWAYMCKHVAAVMYAAGARLDEDPLLFFTLRNIDFTELLKKSVAEKMANMLKNSGQKTKRVMAGADIKDLFGV
ncbi:MAG: SWIM zinc finger family protein [Gracilibacteraceae bacterium]|jgi:uncharacterized Zn finger protein|nr:SWIM zinc finger family protein [Gracilibacteraceae bacterium]